MEEEVGEEKEVMSAEGGESGGDEDWNVDECRGDHESDEHWELRRTFMKKFNKNNKGRFPKLRIVCLSQVFANMEFLGCKYPLETMELVSELSVGIIEEYRKNQAGRLQRTFVKASDAAERKSKGTKRPSNYNPNRSAQHENKHFKSDSINSSSHTFPSLSNCFIRASSSSSNDQTTNKGNNEVYEEIINQYGNDVKGLVLVQQLYVDNEGPIQILNRSCAMCHKNFAFNYEMASDGETLCSFTIGNSSIAQGKGSTKEKAKLAVADLAWNNLKKVCYTIEMKAMVVSNTEVSKDDIGGVEIKKEHSALQEDNIGNKLLKLMGWVGGGLGKNQQGIEKPVSTPDVVERRRLGLGLSSIDADLGRTIKKFLQDQMWQCAQFDLQFSPEFNSDERKVIHQVASQLGLRSRSHGKADNRFLVISRKIQLTDLLDEILRTGETAKYRVIQPDLMGIATTVHPSPSKGWS